MRFLIPLMCVVLVLSGCGQDANHAAPPAPVAGAATPPPVPTAPPKPVATQEVEYSFAGLPEPYQSANYNIGRRVFRLCSTCHFLKANMGNSVGPNLNGVFGRQIGSADGFNYSQALQDANFVWTPEKLDQWLQGPKAFLPGNRMIFQGVRKQTERDAVIAYIMKESGYRPEAASE